MALKVVICAAFFLLLSATRFVDSDRNQSSIEWQILTKRNFSSQIRTHPHILLIVTVPWCGESRTLMKEVANQAATKEDKFGHLRLMIVYRNNDKMLADVLGATEGITIFFYHHSVRYKYRGRLRMQNIFTSLDHLRSLKPDELPLKTLSTVKDLNTFLQSTDKAVLLLEFCGWTPSLLRKNKDDEIDSALHVQCASDNDGIHGENLSSGVHQTLLLGVKENQKGLKTEKLTCGVENGLNGVPWLGAFNWENETSPLLEDGDNGTGDEVSCTLEEFQRFELFFLKFTTMAREHFLPPERQRFGLVSKRSLLSFLGVENLDTWSLMLHFMGCPNCSKILSKQEEIKSAMLMHHTLAPELEGNGGDLELALPGNKPSIILFVDRSSQSSKIKRKSKLALEIFRNLSLSYQPIEEQNSIISEGISNQTLPTIGGISISDQSGRLTRKLSPAHKLVKFRDKMAYMIINEGENKALDNLASGAQRNSAQDILDLLLKQKNLALPMKEGKISILAKEVGFQLLSDDFEVKIVDKVPPREEHDQPEKDLTTKLMNPEIPELPIKSKVENGVDLNSGNLLRTITNAAAGNEKQQEPVDAETSIQYNREGGPYAEENTELFHTQSAQEAKKAELGIVESMGSSENDHRSNEKDVGPFTESSEQPFHLDQDSQSSGVPFLKEHIHKDPGSHVEHGFNYTNSDGALDTHVGDSLEPAIVANVVAKETHSVVTSGKAQKFHQCLPSYQRVQSVPVSPREAPQPPFVNLDFREADSIPRVTLDAFSEMVLGFNQCDTGYALSCFNNHHTGPAWKKDVLVLFSNTWCGFCQRMELVVREVYRAFKGYISVLGSDSSFRRSMQMQDNLDDVMLNELPSIFLMDCTLNDCSALLQLMGQGEVYPALMLFPAEKKDAIPYQGHLSVSNVIEFIAALGSNSRHLIGNKGILWAGAQKVYRSMGQEASSDPVHEQVPIAKSEYHEVLLNVTAKRVDKPHSFKLHTSYDFNGEGQEEGFQGLITNKHIKWDILPELDEGFTSLKKAPLSFGGPVVAPGMPLVSFARRAAEVGYLEVVPSFYYGDQMATFQAIEGIKSGNLSAIDYWFFLGYSSWGWSQLFAEVAEGAWRISNYQMEQLRWPER
ncbi:hypothetical protein AAC387_Pa04g2266 [Persea americana]